MLALALLPLRSAAQAVTLPMKLQVGAEPSVEPLKRPTGTQNLTTGTKTLTAGLSRETSRLPEPGRSRAAGSLWSPSELPRDLRGNAYRRMRGLPAWEPGAWGPCCISLGTPSLQPG